MKSLTILLLISIFSGSLAFLNFRPTAFASKVGGVKTVDLLKPAPLSALLVPSLALADGIDSSPVLIPLAISLLTIVPFYYYSQALAPKPRKAQQVELDENLRPKDKKLGQGKLGQAVAKRNDRK